MLKRMRGWLSDELLNARIQYWGWMSIGIPISYVLRSSVPYVVFLSVYAIVDGNATKVKTARALLAAQEQVPEGSSDAPSPSEGPKGR